MAASLAGSHASGLGRARTACCSAPKCVAAAGGAPPALRKGTAVAAAAAVPPAPPAASVARTPPFQPCPLLAVTHDEVDALHELYHKLSNELHKDNLIHKDEFMWALFKANRDNLFAERVGASDWLAACVLTHPAAIRCAGAGPEHLFMPPVVHLGACQCRLPPPAPPAPACPHHEYVSAV